MILGVALVVRLVLIVAAPVYLFGDPADYHRLAASIAAGHGYPSTEIATPGTPSALRPPGYPYLLGGLYSVVGDHPQAGRLLGVLLGLLTVALIALLGRAAWSERVGLLAGGIAAVFLPLAALNNTLLSESLFLPLELGAALSLAWLHRSGARLRASLVCGALVGLAALVRDTADLWLLGILGAVAACRAPARVRLRSAAACVAAALAVVAPWTIRNVRAFHAPVPISTESGYMLAGQYNEMADRGGAIRAVWHLPTTQAPDVERAVAPLFARRGGVNEVQLDGALRRFALRYEERHPLHLLVAATLDALRLFAVGPGHGFTSALSYRELNVPPWLRLPTTLTLWLVVLLALGGGAFRLARRAGAFRVAPRGGRVALPPLGPWWLWTLPLLDLLVTLPVTGTLRKRAPLDPFVVLLAALALEGLLRRRAARSPLKLTLPAADV